MNHLQIVITICALAFSGRSDSTPVSDVLGDAVAGSFATYDITSIDATFTTTTLTFVVALSSAPLAPSAASNSGIYGFIDIDTGSTSFPRTV
jgi:hypothetical protein